MFGSRERERNKTNRVSSVNEIPKIPLVLELTVDLLFPLLPFSFLVVSN